MTYASWSVVFGEQPSAAKWNILGTNDAYFDALIGSGTAWTTYSPTFTSVSGGTATGNYVQFGKFVRFKAKYVLAGAGVSGSPTVTLPVTATSFFASNSGVIGHSEFVDTGVTNYTGSLRLNSTTVAGLLVNSTNGLQTAVSSTVPFTFGSGDVLLCTGSYEAA